LLLNSFKLICISLTLQLFSSPSFYPQKTYNKKHPKCQNLFNIVEPFYLLPSPTTTSTTILQHLQTSRCKYFSSFKKNISYKKTVVFDPSKSDTYRALQEDQYGYGERVQEIPIPVQTRVYQPNRLVPGKKPQASYPPPQPQQYHNVNSMGDSNDTIHQSHSFKRLMYSVMGETDY